MTDAADPTLTSPADPVLDRAERRLARLDRLADLALELAEAEQRRALETLAGEPEGAAPAKRPAAADPRAGFDRAARALRLTVALQAELEKDLAEHRREAQARARAVTPAKPLPRSPLQVRKDALVECVDQAIDETVDDGREGLLLGADLRERLEREGDSEALLNRPFGVVLAEICAELGLKPDWSLWRDETWAIEETRMGVEGSPYAAPPYARRRRDLPDNNDEADAAFRDRLMRMGVLNSSGP